MILNEFLRLSFEIFDRFWRTWICWCKLPSELKSEHPWANVYL